MLFDIFMIQHSLSAISMASKGVLKILFGTQQWIWLSKSEPYLRQMGLRPDKFGLGKNSLRLVNLQFVELLQKLFRKRTGIYDIYIRTC